MADRKVKGSLLVDYARMIKANKDKDWNRYLKPEDWEILNQRILPSFWYSFETFQRCGLAAFHLIAGDNLDLVRQWGKISTELLVKGPYKMLEQASDPYSALERFNILRGQLFNFDIFTLELKKIGEKGIKIRAQTSPNEEGNDTYIAQKFGSTERLVELTGGKNPKIVVITRPKRGAPLLEFDVTWD